jgi:hypothetical protein
MVDGSWKRLAPQRTAPSAAILVIEYVSMNE